MSYLASSETFDDVIPLKENTMKINIWKISLLQSLKNVTFNLIAIGSVMKKLDAFTATLKNIKTSSTNFNL